jgi:hypothetical protein
MNGLELVRGLMDRGYSAHHAAALAGHMLQESGGNPTAVNKGENANGLLQWRLDRWDNLQNYAKGLGKNPYDADVQMDFLRREMSGPESRAGGAFMAAPDVDSASAALKGYIRFGDKSDETRLNNARGLFSQINSGPVGALAGAPVTAAGPVKGGAEVAPVGALATSTPSPTSTSAPNGTSSEALMQLANKTMGQQPEFLEPMQLQMARPNVGQSSQIAAALAKAYGIGG